MMQSETLGMKLAKMMIPNRGFIQIYLPWADFKEYREVIKTSEAPHVIRFLDANLRFISTKVSENAVLVEEIYQIKEGSLHCFDSTKTRGAPFLVVYYKNVSTVLVVYPTGE